MESVQSASSLCSTFVEEVHARTVLQELWRQSKSEEFCDVVLIAGTTEKRIPAHSCILSAASKYFKGMLPPCLSKGTAKEIKISSVDGDIIQSLVKYCYTGRIAITEDNAVKLLKNANELFLSDIIPACANFLVEQLQPGNCLGYKRLAEQYGCEILVQKARDYSLEHFMAVQETDEFLSLKPDQLGELLACDNLNVSSEEYIFNSLLAWLRHNPIEREKYQAEMLKLVRLPLLEKVFLIEHVKPICTSLECREIYMEAIEQHSVPHYIELNKRKSVKSGKTNQFLMGITMEGPELHLGIKINQPKTQIHYHCPQRLQWMKCLKDLEYRMEFGVAVMDDNIFLVGGYNNVGGLDNVLNTVVCLNLKTMNLKEVSPMLEHRRNCRAAVLNGFLYVVGGSDLKSAEKWNPKTNKWSTVDSMLNYRSDFGLVVLNQKLFAVGGIYDSGCRALKSAECYDPHQNEWMSIAPLNEFRSSFGLAVSNGLLYAVGGDNASTVERYNPEFNSWTMLCSLSQRWENFKSCTTFRDKVIMCYKDRVEEYDEETNVWKASASLKGFANNQLIVYSGELLASAFVDN